jgi:TrbM
MSSQPPEMQSLVSAISQGAGRCDATSLNSVLRSWSGLDDSYTYISNSLPDYCAVFMGNSYSGVNHNYIFPRYVGTQERGGYWVEARDYEQALADYNERIRREDEERQNAY